MRFDPERLRKELIDGPVGIDSSLADDFNIQRAKNALDSTALVIEWMGIQCLLVGLNEAGVTLLDKARHWIESAIALGEIPNNHYDKYGSEAERLFRLVCCRWLLYGMHDQKSLDEGTRFSDLYYESFDDAEYRQCQAEQSIVRYLEAGRYARGIELYERENLPQPKDFAGVSTEWQMAYILCEQRLRKSYAEVDVNMAVRRFLSRNVGPWLAGGQYNTAALWMKLTAWDGVETAESARRALLCCYDYLRGLKRPAVHSS